MRHAGESDDDGLNELIQVNCKGSYGSSLLQFPVLCTTQLNCGSRYWSCYSDEFVSTHSMRYFSLVLRLFKTGCARNFLIKRFGGDSGNTKMTDNNRKDYFFYFLRYSTLTDSDNVLVCYQQNVSGLDYKTTIHFQPFCFWLQMLK